MGLSPKLYKALTARVSRVDPARTLAARLAPKAEADRLIGLYAFHYEIARVAETVSDQTMGEIRLQWWREAIDEIRTGKPLRAHDAARALQDSINPIKARFPFELLDALVEARERDLEPTPFDAIAEVIAYAETTAGQLALAAAHALAKTEIGPNVHVGILDAGRAWGLAGLAREVAIAQQFKARPRLPINVGADEIAAAARKAYAAAKGALQNAPAELLPAYAYATLVPSLTQRFTLEAASPFAMRWRILKAAVVGGI